MAESTFVLDSYVNISDDTYETDDLGKDSSICDETSQWDFASVLHSLIPGQTLSAITIPSVFLQPRSLLETLSDLMMHTDILDDPKLSYGEESDRFLVVLKYYLSCWHYQVSGCKKPINPVLGETFSCMTESPNHNQYFYISEQVSKSPSITAFYMESINNGIKLQGEIIPSGVFTGNTVKCSCNGEVTLTVLQNDESYIATFPNLIVTGVFTGPLHMEFNGKTTLSCDSTGFDAVIDWKPSSDPCSSSNIIKGVISFYKTPVYHIQGKWDTGFVITDLKTNNTREFLNIKKLNILPKVTLKKQQQHKYESLSLWSDVVSNIKSAVLNDNTNYTNSDLKLQKIEAEEQNYQNNQKFESKLFKKVVKNKVAHWEFIHACSATTEPRNLMYYSTHLNAREDPKITDS